MVVVIIFLSICVLGLGLKLISDRKDWSIKRIQWEADIYYYKESARHLDEWKKACWDAQSSLIIKNDALKETTELLDAAQEQIIKLTHQKKSSEVKTGFIVEHMAPFLDSFPFDPKAARHLGVPIDYVVFDDAGVHFVEIKSGDASLTAAQRKIRDQIENNQVSFEIFRIK